MTVHASEKWWKVKQHIPRDRKYKGSRKLYTFRGPGVGVERHWTGRFRRDLEDLYFLASHNTRRRVKSLLELWKFFPPLGWKGKGFVDEHPDGTRTILWRVKLIHFSMETGKALETIGSISFRIK